MSEKILEKISSVKVESIAKEYPLQYFDLKKYSIGENIEKELPEKHLFDRAEVYVVIASLIAKQLDGEEGALKTSDWNLFYTEKFVVSVRWRSEDGLWDVVVWDRGADWLGGRRVFSPGAEN